MDVGCSFSSLTKRSLMIFNEGICFLDCWQFNRAATTWVWQFQAACQVHREQEIIKYPHGSQLCGVKQLKTHTMLWIWTFRGLWEVSHKMPSNLWNHLSLTHTPLGRPSVSPEVMSRLVSRPRKRWSLPWRTLRSQAVAALMAVGAPVASFC